MAGGCAGALLNSKGRALRPGELLNAEADPAVAFAIVGKAEDAQWELEVRSPVAGESTFAILARIGRTPLPPYIRRQADSPDGSGPLPDGLRLAARGGRSADGRAALHAPTAG